MEKKSEKEFYDNLTRDIVQNYFKITERRNIVIIQNAEQSLITKICNQLEEEAGKKGKLVQKIEATELKCYTEPADETILIINDPNSTIGYNGKMKDRSYHINVNELIKIFRNSHQQRVGYRRPSSDQGY
ncbi:MAG: hypothetical protein QW404_02265 [Candidatus Nanoarchaeia archaeon]